MNNDKQKKKEELLSEYIDKLNQEKKPTLSPDDYDLSSDEAQEIDDLLETVKAVKRLKQVPEEKPSTTTATATSKSTPLLFRKNFLRASSVAAVFLLLMTGLFQFNRSESPHNIIYAMIQSYEEISSLEGVMEFSLRNDQEVLLEETRLITYKKPDMFRIVTITNARTFTKIYDGGDTMVSFHGEGNGDLIVDYMSDELMSYFLEDYHIGTHIYKLEGAIDIEKLGEETLNGRDSHLYQYRYTAEDPYHRMWVDTSTNLPLKIESNYNNGDQIIREYQSITINPPIDRSIFSYEVAKGSNIHETTAPLDEDTREVSRPPEDGSVITVTFEGRIDNQSAEFTQDGQFLVLMLHEEVMEEFDSISPGSEIRVTIEESPISDNKMIVAINQ